MKTYCFRGTAKSDGGRKGNRIKSKISKWLQRQIIWLTNDTGKLFITKDGSDESVNCKTEDADDSGGIIFNENENENSEYEPDVEGDGEVFYNTIIVSEDEQNLEPDMYSAL